MDPDHRLLLRNTKPLLQSRNAAVRPLHFYIIDTLYIIITQHNTINSPFESVTMLDIVILPLPCYSALSSRVV